MLIKPASLPPTIFETFPRIVRTAATGAGAGAGAVPVNAAFASTKQALQVPPPPLGTLLGTSLGVSLGVSQNRRQQLQPLIPLAGISILTHNPGAQSYQIRSMTTTNTNTNTSSTGTDPFQTYAITTPVSALNPNPGVSLSSTQELILCSVLDLFSGNPTKRKLTLWTDTASFHDPLTNSVGRRQYEAQWYGLKAAFSQIERLSCETVSAGQPLEMKVKTKYKVKGLGSEQVIESTIAVETEGAEGGEGVGGGELRIKKVSDLWGGEIKDGPVKNALRGLNAVTVPLIVGVPKSVEEEEASWKK